MINIIHGELWSDDFSSLNQLIKDFQSCVRFSFCRFDKNKMEFNEVRRMAKIAYPRLNSAQASDAVLQGRTCKNVLLAQQERYEEAKTKIENKLKGKLSKKRREKLEERLERVNRRIKYPKMIFGGRKSWEDFRSGKITKEEWTGKRDGQIYSRGEKTHTGNPNLRIIGDTLRVTIGRKQWISYKLYTPDKFKQELNELIQRGQAYNVRLIRKDKEHFYVKIDYQTENPEPIITFDKGVIGVDTNPDRISVAEVSKDGNLLDTDSFINHRIKDASTNKRDYDLGCLVKDVITYAKEKDKGIVFENLDFEQELDNNRKSNRMKSNFPWRRFIDLLERKCIEHQIQYEKVDPAYTSIIGKYKYRKMHRINIHESAAYVIGRRGLGYGEKLSFYKIPQEQVKKFIIKTLDGKYGSKKNRLWRMWKVLNDNVEAALTGLHVRLTDLKEFVGNIWYCGEILQGEIFLRELQVGSNIRDNVQTKEDSSSKADNLAT